jgi:predicted membrane protein
MASPIRYVKAHPMATVITALAGMAVGPWILGTVNKATGVSVRIPTVGR